MNGYYELEMNDWYIDFIWDWELGYDRDGIGEGGERIDSDKTAPYGGAIREIFVYWKGGGGIDLFGYFY